LISVRIPDEIRKYKEKILFGLNARQLVATVLTFLICVPLYYFGKKYISEDILSWLIIIIAVPLISIGFFKFNGMPMEKFIIEVLKFELLFPQKRRYKVENAFKEWERKADKELAPKSFLDKIKYKRYLEEASLEKILMMEKAEKRGDTDYNLKDFKPITVNKSWSHNPKKNNNKKDKKNKTKKKTVLQKKAEQIEKKKDKDPLYKLTNEEIKVMKKWNAKKLELKKKEINEEKKIVRKKSNVMKKRRNAKTTIPRTTQQTIPFLADYDEGLFEVRANKFSKLYKLKDINYRTSKEDEQVTIFVKLTEFLNYFSEDMNFAFVIDNRVISKDMQERKIFFKETGDKYDRHRKEYNGILRRQIMAGRNDIQIEKFLTITIDANSPIEALLRFHKIDDEIIANLRKIGSDAVVVSTTDRLSYYHDKFRKGKEGEFQIDYDFIKSQGISSKDYIAPTFFRFENKHFQIEDDFYRVMFLNNLPKSLSDEVLFDLCDNSFPVTTSISIQPVSQDKGLKIVQRQLTGILTNKMDAEKRAIRGGYSPESIQHSIIDAHKQAEELYDDMLNKSQKMFFVTITFMIHGSTLDELNENCKIIESKARKYTSQLQTLTMQQEEGFKITLPFGYTPQSVGVERTLTSESTAIFMPFSNQELFQPAGFFYGLNQISRNLVVINRTQMKTPSGFVLGTSGSGKSFQTKKEILQVILSDSNTGVLIIDPENEYGDFSRAFDGTVLKISADSNNYINPLDMGMDYGLDEDDPPDTPISVKKDKALKKKSDYIMSIIERMICNGNNADFSSITPVQKTIVDRCVSNCYRKYFESDFDTQYLPTLLDLQNELDKEKSTEEGRLLANGVEYYTRGSMNIFAHKTNVAIENRLVVFNVRDLGEQLRQIGLIIIFDFIWNRMINNKNRGVRTYCYADEIHVMFNSFYSANFLKQLYKRGRKYGLCITGLTQNVEDLLRSEQARGMIGNSDFIMMLNQNSEDLKILASMLNISETLMGFVKGADVGSGLIFAEKVTVPFVDRFPLDSYLYPLMSTKFGEDMSKKEIDEKIRQIMYDEQESNDVNFDSETEVQMQEIKLNSDNLNYHSIPEENLNNQYERPLIESFSKQHINTHQENFYSNSRTNYNVQQRENEIALNEKEAEEILNNLLMNYEDNSYSNESLRYRAELIENVKKNQSVLNPQKLNIYDSNMYEVYPNENETKKQIENYSFDRFYSKDNPFHQILKDDVTFFEEFGKDMPSKSSINQDEIKPKEEHSFDLNNNSKIDEILKELRQYK